MMGEAPIVLERTTRGRIVCFVLILILSFSAIPIQLVTAEEYYSRHYEWDYGGYPWTWDLSIPKSSYDAYRNVPVSQRTMYGVKGYDSLATTNDPYIRQLAELLRDASQKKGWGSYDEVGFVLAFVQSLPYTYDDVTTGYHEYPRYPLETLVDNGGDCEDTSILFATIVGILGYGVALLYLDQQDHVAAGVAGGEDVRGTYYDYEGGRYFYCETTGTGWKIGQVPNEYKNARAYVIPVTGGHFVPRVSASSISCFVSPSSINYGQSITVYGSISPIRRYTTVTLRYTRPDGYTITRTVKTDGDGDFRDVFTPDKIGWWRVKASWAGDEDFHGAESPPVSFSVESRFVLEDLTSPFRLPLYSHGGYDHCMLYFLCRSPEPINVKITFRGAGTVDVYDWENDRFLLDPVSISGSRTFTISWDGRGFFEPRVTRGSSITSIILEEWSFVKKGYFLEDIDPPFTISLNPYGGFDHCMVYLMRRDREPTKIRISFFGSGTVDVYDPENDRFLLEPTMLSRSKTFEFDWDGRGLLEPRVLKGSRITSISLRWSKSWSYFLEDIGSSFRIADLNPYGDFDHCRVYFSRKVKEPVTIKISFYGMGTVDVFDGENNRFLLEPTGITRSTTFTIDWDGRGFFEPRVLKGSSITSIYIYP